MPRSISTAFERMMSARGDLAVVSEPFSAHYYFGPDRSNTRYPPEAPGPEHDPFHVRAQLIDQAKTTPLFFKDMAYHISSCMSPEFLEPFTSALLIRDPRFSVPSLFRRVPDFTLEETGFDQLLRLARMLTEQAGQSPLVIDGETLRSNPASVYREFCQRMGIDFVPEALSWEPGEEKHWSRWNDWHQEAASSSGIRPPAAAPDLEALAVPRVAEAVEHCRPLYKELSRHAIPV